MKKWLIASLACACLVGEAKNLPDSVVMTVGGKPVPLSEFLFIARKNGEVDLSDEKSVKEYAKLFKNFKLKVADAEALGMDTTAAFKEELEGYRAQLVAGYLSDPAGEEAAARAVYDRGNELLELSQILFRLPEKCLTKDTVPVYEEARKVYERIQAGEDLDSVGKELAGKAGGHIAYEHVRCLQPMQTVEAFEKAAYELPVGIVSQPVRTKMGFHLIQVHRRKPNPGLVRVSHILIAFPKDSAGKGRQETLARAESVLRRVKAGEDFGKLAETCSDDAASAKQGGALPEFGAGVMIEPFERAAFSLQTAGEISGLVETRFGYHIIKLIEKKPRPSFEASKKALIRQMGQGERNFELYAAFDDRMKKEYGYKFYPEAYAELQALCNDYFPSDRSFYEKAEKMEKTLLHLDGTDFPQNEFAYYIQRCPFSTKTYAGDFMWEVYNLFVRDIVTTSERKNLEKKHPEYANLMQEYRDGILLFNISNQKVWSKPAAEQAEAEVQWLTELDRKYPVVINWKLLKKQKNK